MQVCSWSFTGGERILFLLCEVTSEYVGLYVDHHRPVVIESGVCVCPCVVCVRVCVQADRSTIEISEDSLGIASPLKLLHHQPLTKRWIIRFIFSAQCVDCKEYRLVKVTPRKLSCCSFPTVGVNVIPGDVFDWSSAGFL